MKNIICFCLSLLLISLLSACSKNHKHKDVADVDIQTPENTLDWHGTYEGIMPAADCPGIYVLLAIDTTTYEMACKYIDRPGINISMGNIKWNAGGDSLTLLADHRTYRVDGGSLYLGKFQLTKTDDAVKLPKLLITQTLKDDKSGDNAVLEEYSVGHRHLANFYFDDKTYKLTLDEKNMHRKEYTDGKTKLLLDSLDTKRLQWDIHPTFINNNDTCHFTVLSPINEIYTATGKPDLTNSFDVLYLNGEDGSEVMLLNPINKYCFTLPQVESSAKAATYYNDGVSWSSTLHGATLSLGDQIYQYLIEPKQ